MSVKELWEKYPLVIERYSPFVHLSIAQGEVIDDANRNEDKYAKRSSRTLDCYGYDDEMSSQFHKELMKGLDWGILYNKYHNNTYDPVKFASEVKRLIADKDVTKNSGIYEYLLSGDEKFLQIRAFDDDQKMEAYVRQNGICPKCGEHFEFDEMQGDHITPWSKCGKTISENCQMLCADCNRRKSNA